MLTDDQQQAIQTCEHVLEDKIKTHFSYIPGLMVSVTVKLNNTRQTVHSTTYDVKNAVVKPIETSSKTSDTAGRCQLRR